MILGIPVVSNIQISVARGDGQWTSDHASADHFVATKRSPGVDT
jgi:hypothetical protein